MWRITDQYQYESPMPEETIHSFSGLLSKDDCDLIYLPVIRAWGRALPSSLSSARWHRSHPCVQHSDEKSWSGNSPGVARQENPSPRPSAFWTLLLHMGSLLFPANSKCTNAKPLLYVCVYVFNRAHQDKTIRSYLVLQWQCEVLWCLPHWGKFWSPLEGLLPVQTLLYIPVSKLGEAGSPHSSSAHKNRHATKHKVCFWENLSKHSIHVGHTDLTRHQTYVHSEHFRHAVTSTE